MLKDLSYLIEEDLSNFYSSNVKTMKEMLSGCIYLKSINFNNFVTSLVEDMNFCFIIVNH